MEKRTKNHIIEITCDKVTLENGKKGRSFIAQLISVKRAKVYFIQMDKCLWWLPKIIKDDGENFKGRSYGWLFLQIGYLKFI